MTRSLLLVAALCSFGSLLYADTGSVTGRVVIASSSQTVAGAYVTVLDRTSNDVVQAGETDVNGRYHLDVAPGTYKVSARVEGHPSQIFSGIDCLECEEAGTPVIVTAAHETSAIDFAIHEWGFIDGTVIDEKTKLPIANATVYAFGARTAPSGGYTDAAGHYRLTEAIRPGESYMVLAQVEGYFAELYDNIRCLPECSGGTLVTVPGYGLGTTHIDFALNKGGEIRGVIRDRDTGEPIPDIRIDVYDATGASRGYAGTASDGSYSTGSFLLGDTYYVRASNPAYVDQVFDGIECPDPNHCHATAGTPIHLAEGSQFSADFRLRSRQGTVSGRVVDKWTGAPIGGMLLIFTTEIGTRVEVTTGPDGRYRTPKLFANTYYVTTWNELGYQNQTYGGAVCLGCDVTTGTPIVVGERQDLTDVNFSMSSFWIDRLQPAFLPRYGGRLLIRGHGFTRGVRVEIDGHPVNVVSVSPEFVTVDAPSHEADEVEVKLIGTAGQIAVSPAPLVYSREAFRVKDIQTIPVDTGRYRAPWGTAGALTYFSAADPEHGQELWRSDGTTAGTQLVADLCPGFCSTTITQAHAAGNLLFFMTLNEDYSGSMWRTDGTTDGTFVVSNFVHPFEWRGVEFRGKLFFTCEELQPRAIWVSDGTVGGTHAAIDLDTLALYLTSQHTVAGDRLYFTAKGGSGVELYSTDGTTAGTQIVIDLVPGPLSSNPHILAALGNRLMFTAAYGTHDPELFSASGPSGAVMISSAEDLTWESVREAVSVNEKLLGVTGGYDPLLVANDGTTPETILLGDLDVVGDINVAGKTAFFTVRDPQTGLELWCSDGTLEGTHLVKDIEPGEGSADVRDLIVFHNRVLFTAGAAKRELWSSDGTEGGTFPLTHFADSSMTIHDLSASEAGVFFYVDEPADMRIWITAGTPNSTWPLAAVPQSQTYSSDPHGFVSIHDVAYFFAKGELWRSDGSARGTYRVANINQYGAFGNGYEAKLTVFNDRLYFYADDGVHGAELWTSDGTEAGTHMVKDVWPGHGSSVSGNGQLIEYNGALVFSAVSDETQQPRLWRSDGTDTGTVPFLNSVNFFPARTKMFFVQCDAGAPPCDLMVMDGFTNPVRVTGMPSNFVPLGVTDDLFFFQNDADRTVWRTDGSAAGTFQINSGMLPFGAIVLEQAAVGNLLFVAIEHDLWVSDGTSAGTRKIATFATRAPGSSVFVTPTFRAAGNLLYFIAGDGAAGFALWRSDGTSAGTSMLRDGDGNIMRGSAFASIGSEVFFMERDFSQRWRLWKTDGSPAGTVMLARGIEPNGVAITKDYLLFAAGDAEPSLYGVDVELWALPLHDPVRRRASHH
jgi:ELWxxDGT repeat protein